MENNIIIGSNLLETITSALYENPIILFREYVQNSLDAYNEATQKRSRPAIPDLRVEIQIDETSKTIIIKDNGYGIEGDGQFTEKMLGFGNSGKEDRTQFIGFRGIGRISALPFCDKLIFVNKSQGSRFEDICIWKGKKYRNILNNTSKVFPTFEDVVSEVVSINQEPSKASESEHFFKVIIENYGYEIEEVKSNPNFEQSLRKLLPLRYSESFTAAIKIIQKYKEYMNEDLTYFMISVYLNGKELQKNYTDIQHVLDSNIIIWPLRGKPGEKDQQGEKIGILWFTFNRKMTSNRNDYDYGIFVRSKNVLMGSNDTFADLCLSSKEHVATYSELTATLRGVYGELLINSAYLKDNARREWFRTDEYSIYLKYIIIDFMKRLYGYRYAASKYYRKNAFDKVDKQKEVLKEKLVDLINVGTDSININISNFYDDETKEVSEVKEQGKTLPIYTYADEDIPRQTQTKKKTYDELLKIIQEFLEKEGMYTLFIKLRAYIKRYYQE